MCRPARLMAQENNLIAFKIAQIKRKIRLRAEEKARIEREVQAKMAGVDRYVMRICAHKHLLISQGCRGENVDEWACVSTRERDSKRGQSGGVPPFLSASCVQ